MLVLLDITDLKKGGVDESESDKTFSTTDLIFHYDLLIYYFFLPPILCPKDTIYFYGHSNEFPFYTLPPVLFNTFITLLSVANRWGPWDWKLTLRLTCLFIYLFIYFFCRTSSQT